MDSEVKEEVGTISRRVCDAFTNQYTQAYVVELVKLIKQKSQPANNPNLLSERPTWTATIKKGWLVKEGAINRSWKKRWVVVHSSYLVDYYDGDQQKDKKGTMNLAGYTVVEDPNLAALARLKKLAEKMGIDFRNIPKPKEYPPLVFELYHPYRRCYYLKASSVEEFKDWCSQFKYICWNIEGSAINDECHKTAFPLAIRNTKWALGRWGYYYYGGSEEQILTDMITDEVDAEVMGRAYSKMSGPWFVRNTLRGQLQKITETTVKELVKPSWSGVARAITLLRPKLEPSIRSLLSSLFDFELKFNGYMRENAMVIIGPLIQKHVVHSVAKIAAMFKEPLQEAFNEIERAFIRLVEAWKPLEDLNESFRDLDYFPRGHFDIKAALNILNTIYEPLWALNLTFKDIAPWPLIWKAHALIRKLADNLVWTWEQVVVSHSSRGSTGPNAVLWTKSLMQHAREATEEVVNRFRMDTATATTIFLREMVLAVVLPPLQFDLVPLSNKLLEPLIPSTPDQLVEFCDLKHMFEEFYTKEVENCVDQILNGSSPIVSSPPPSSSFTVFSSHHKDMESFKPLPSPPSTPPSSLAPPPKPRKPSSQSSYHL